MSANEILPLPPDALCPLQPEAAFTGPIIWCNHSLTYGGVERQIHATAEALAGKVELQLLCQSLEGDDSDAFLERVKPFFSNISDIFSNAPLYSAYAAEALRMAELHFSGLHPMKIRLLAMHTAYFAVAKPRLVQIWNADSVHVALAGVLAGVPNILMRCASKSPGFRFPRGIESINDAVAYKVFHYLLHFPAVFLTANSQDGLKDYEAWLGLPPGTVQYTPNAFVPEQWAEEQPRENLRAQLNIPADAPVIGGAFRFSFMKNPHLWVQTVFAVLEAHQEAYAILIGDGDLFPEIAEMVANSPYASRLLLLGMFKDTLAFYNACNVILHTSLCEGMCNVVLEAQYHGIPVVCTDCGGVFDSIANTKTGFIVQDADPKSLSAHVIYILNHPEWAATASALAHTRVARAFSSKRAALTYLRIYSERGCI